MLVEVTAEDGQDKSYYDMRNRIISNVKAGTAKKDVVTVAFLDDALDKTFENVMTTADGENYN